MIIGASLENDFGLQPQLQALQTILTALQECLARGTNDHDRLTFGQEQDADRECQVCMDSKVQVVLQCSHGFCQTCLDDWYGFCVNACDNLTFSENS